jgi:flagellar basal body rod protein FlgF
MALRSPPVEIGQGASGNGRNVRVVDADGARDAGGQPREIDGFRPVKVHAGQARFGFNLRAPARRQHGDARVRISEPRVRGNPHPVALACGAQVKIRDDGVVGMSIEQTQPLAWAGSAVHVVPAHCEELAQREDGREIILNEEKTGESHVERKRKADARDPAGAADAGNSNRMR